MGIMIFIIISSLMCFTTPERRKTLVIYILFGTALFCEIFYQPVY